MVREDSPGCNMPEAAGYASISVAFDIARTRSRIVINVHE